MANKFIVEISESVEQLQKMLPKQKTAQSKERLQMLYWLKSGDLTTRQALAQRLHRTVFLR